MDQRMIGPVQMKHNSGAGKNGEKNKDNQRIGEGDQKRRKQVLGVGRSFQPVFPGIVNRIFPEDMDAEQKDDQSSKDMEAKLMQANKINDVS